MPFNRQALLNLVNTSDRNGLLYMAAIHLEMIEVLVNAIELIHKVGGPVEKDLASKAAQDYHKLIEKINLLPVTPKAKANDITKH